MAGRGRGGVASFRWRIRRPENYNIPMRWLWIGIESIASGLFAVFTSLVVFVIALQLYSRHVLGLRPGQSVQWDPVSLSGTYWKIALVGVPLAIFGVGCATGYRFFSRRVHRKS